MVTSSPALIVPAASTTPTIPRFSFAALENSVSETFFPDFVLPSDAWILLMSPHGGLYSSTISSAPDANCSSVPLGRRDSSGMPSTQRFAPRLAAVIGFSRSISAETSCNSSTETADHWRSFRLTVP